VDAIVKDRMITGFVMLSEDTNPSQAQAQLAPNGFMVVLDRRGEPVALLTAEDVARVVNGDASSLLDRAVGLPPAVVVGGNIKMRDVVESGAYTAFDIGIGARGAIVMGDAGVVGVLPVDTIDEYLSSAEIAPSGRTMGATDRIGTAPPDSRLGGEYLTPLARVLCARCGFVNTVRFLDLAHMPDCQNSADLTHQLQLG